LRYASALLLLVEPVPVIASTRPPETLPPMPNRIRPPPIRMARKR
jgi:hypothetical protein